MISGDGKRLTLDGFLTCERPFLAHVMYRFLDPTWDVWNWVASRAVGNAEPDMRVTNALRNAGRRV